METTLYRTGGEKRDGNIVTRTENRSFQEDTEGTENELLNLYPEMKFERFEGFGGAITDSAAYVYSLMEEEQKRELLETYFLEKEMDYRLVRIHMDSCDFSTEMYEAMSDPADRELKSFSFERTEKYIIPMLQDAERISGKKLKLMLSPWSPPAFMKTNGCRVRGGSLKPEYRRMWADYLCRYIKEFETRGFRVQRISLQNEPKAVQTWDSCVYTAEEEKEFLINALYPALRDKGLEHIEVFIWDHNKERAYERAAAIVDERTKDMVAGVACHWYSGDHFENLSFLKRAFPKLKIIVSESCIEYSKFDGAEEERNAGRLSHELIGDLNHGVEAFYDWNLLLDEQGGPNHVGNYCQAPFLYHTKEKRLMPQLLLKHFYHFSHFIREGDRRIGISRYTEKLDAAAYQKEDGRIVYVLLNRSEGKLPVTVRLRGQILKLCMEPGEIITGIINKG